MTSPSDRLSAALAGRYRIERHLGEGGMASVYLCEHLKHDRKVALKLLKPERAAVLDADRFVVEIQTTASLLPPHITHLASERALRPPHFTSRPRSAAGPRNFAELVS